MDNMNFSENTGWWIGLGLVDRFKARRAHKQGTCTKHMVDYRWLDHLDHGTLGWVVEIKFDSEFRPILEDLKNKWKLDSWLRKWHGERPIFRSSHATLVHPAHKEKNSELYSE